MTEKQRPFDPKRILAFLGRQAEQGEVNVERTSKNLFVQTPSILFCVRWSSTYARLFETDGPRRVRLTGMRENLPTTISAEQHWFLTIQQCFDDGQTAPARMTHLLAQREVSLYRKIVDEQHTGDYWIPKAVTDLLAETVEELNEFFHWQFSSSSGWLAGLDLQSRESLFLRASMLVFDD